MRDTTIFYRSFYEAIKELPKENQAEIYTAIFEHSLNNNLVELSGISKTIYTLIKPQIEANLKRFENGKIPKSKQKISKLKAKDKQKISKVEANNNNNNNNNKKILFVNSPFFDAVNFKNALPEWNKQKLRFYYDAAVTWSGEGNRKIDWIAAVKNWAKKDEREGKLKFDKPEVIDTRGNAGETYMEMFGGK